MQTCRHADLMGRLPAMLDLASACAPAHLQTGEELLRVLVLGHIDGLAVIVFEGVPEASGLESLLLGERHVGKG